MPVRKTLQPHLVLRMVRGSQLALQAPKQQSSNSLHTHSVHSLVGSHDAISTRASFAVCHAPTFAHVGLSDSLGTSLQVGAVHSSTGGCSYGLSSRPQYVPGHSNDAMEQ
eukprot:2773820-Amphidinium_carterae.1